MNKNVVNVIVGLEDLRTELKKYYDFKSKKDKKYYLNILNKAGVILSIFATKGKIIKS